MPKLVFRVAADYDEVIKLRNEIAKLKSELKGMDANATPHAFNALNAQLQTSTKRMNEMVHEAARAGAEMEQGYKRKIFDASQEVNRFTEKIIEQKAVVKDVEADVKRLGETYKTALKNNRYGGSANNALAEYNSAKKVLNEEKAALFGLTQEQAKARLSVKQLRDEYALFKEDGRDAKEAINDIAGNMKGWAAGILGGIGIKEFIGQMIQVRGEFQAADTAIQTLLGSKEKADALMSQVREYAKISPLEFSDVTAATQMMLGFNIEAEKVPKFLAAIGDVSMGETQKFNSLTLAFSQMSAAGKLMGQDLNQMINAGFNPLQTMSDKTGKSIAQLKEEMSKGAITADMVQQAFIDATSAGGKFYNMSENASKNINGQLSMMQDAMDAAFNEMGQKSEGVIMSGIQMTTKLIENYETVGKVLAGLVVTYGVYKAALLTVSIIESARNKTLWTSIAATKAYTAAQGALNAVMNANPYVLLTTVVVGLGTALWAFTKNTDQAAEAQKRLDEATSNMRKEIVSEQADIEVLFVDLKNAKKGTDEYNQAKEAILNKYGKYLNGLNEEIRTLNNVKGAYDAITAAATKAARARGMETAMRGAQDAYSSSYASSSGKIYDALVEKVGETKATSMLRRLQGEISKTGKASQKLRDEIGDIFRGSFDYGNSKTWITTMENATRTFQNETKKIKAVFGDVEESTHNEKKGKKATTYQQDLNSAKKEWDNAKKELSKIEKDKSKFTSKQYEDAKKRKETAEKAYKDLGGVVSTPSTSRTGGSHTDDLAKRLEAERRASDATLSLQRENQDKELELEEETTEKKIKQIELSYDKQIDTIKKKQREIAEQNKKAGAKGLNVNGLTDAQQKEIDKAIDFAGKERDKDKTDIYKEEVQAMRDYLKAYGTYQQKKLAIAEEYAEKIRKAQNEGEKLILEKQQQAAIQKIEIEALKQDIDWKGLLGDFGGMFEEQLKPTLEQLKKYTESDEFKQADINDQKTVYDLISQLQAKTSEGWSGMFRDLGTAVQKVKDAELEQEAAKQKSIKADEEYAEAVKRNTVLTQNGNYVDNSNGEVAEAFKRAQAATNELAESQTKLSNAQNDLSDSASRVRGNMDNLVNGLQQLGSGSMSGVLGGAKSIAKLFGENNLSGAIGKELAAGATKVFGKAVGDALGGPMGGEIVEGVFSLLDLFKDGIENLFVNLIDTVLGAVNGLLSSVLSLDIPKAIGESLRDNLENITNTLVKGLSFGTLGDINWSGSNAKEVAETTNRLTDANERLKVSIDGLKEEIKGSIGANSIKSANEALEAQKNYIENQRDILNTQQGYHSAHHSNAYYWNLDAAVQGQINSLLAEWASKNGKSASKVGSDWSSFSKLSPEEMDYIRKHDRALWDALLNIGKYDKNEYFDAFADLAGSIEEITQSLYETLTTTSENDVFSGFLDSLYSLADGSEDVFDTIADDWQRMVNKMAVNNIVGAKFQTQLKEWYEQLAVLNKERTENTITDAEYKKRLDELQRQYDQYVKNAQDDINALRDAGVIKATGENAKGQEATRGSWEAMGEDTAQELNGRFTALQEYGAQIAESSAASRDNMLLMTASLDTMAANMEQMQGMYSIADETRTILANSYIELQQINENTGAIVKPIKQIQADIAEVKRNTSNL